MLNKNFDDFLILIPAYNEEKTIKKIIKNVSKFGKVLVINDASNDSTKNEALQAGAEVVTHKRNLGYNLAIETGFKFFLKSKYRKIILLDADGQHPISYIKHYKKYLNQNYDVICGVRNNVSRIGEKMFIFLTKLIWKLNDPLCGMKGYSKDFLKKLYEPAHYNFIGTEYLIKAKKKKFKIKEIFIKNMLRKDKSRFGEGIFINFYIIFIFFKCLILIN